MKNIFKNFIINNKMSFISALVFMCFLTILYSYISINEKKIDSKDINIIENTVSSNDIVNNDVIYTIESINTIGHMYATYDENNYYVFKDDTTEYGTSLVVYGASDWNDLIFYVFTSVDEATNSFNYIKNNLILSNENKIESDNFVKGTDIEADGIVINRFYYLTNNMIISRIDFIGDPGNQGITEEPESTKNVNTNRHKLIMEVW